MDSSPSELGIYECNACYGNGIGKENTYIQLLEPCQKCGGSGKVDWVARVVNSNYRPPLHDKAPLERAVMANIALLKSRIIEEGMKVGMQVKLNLEFTDIRNIHLKAAQPLIIPGGLKNVPY